MTRIHLRIGEMAWLLGVTPKTVRHYHKLGLLPEPERSEGGYRLYSTNDLLHLRRIRQLQGLGLSLQQVKFILDSDNPDTLLRMTLEALLDDLEAQQQRLEARKQRIEHLLMEGVTLLAVQQPDSPSPSYQMIQEKAGHLADLELPESIVRFDQQLFAQWDAFDWGEGYATALETTADYLTQPLSNAMVSSLIEKMTALQTMSPHDPQIRGWADEIVESGLLQSLSVSMPEFDPQLAQAMQDMFKQNAALHLSAAQQHFLEILLPRNTD